MAGLIKHLKMLSREGRASYLLRHARRFSEMMEWNSRRSVWVRREVRGNKEPKEKSETLADLREEAARFGRRPDADGGSPACGCPDCSAEVRHPERAAGQAGGG